MTRDGLGSPRSGERLATKTIVVIGLPGSGKTTYISALWYAITQARTGSDLELLSTPTDLSYLNGLMGAWLRCQVAGHTSRSTDHLTTLHLAGSGEGGFQLAIPDYSGEFFADAWATRRLAGQVDQYLRIADGAIVLIHPTAIRPRVTLEEANAHAAALDGGPPNPALTPREFDASESPTQTVLVDFLEFARSRTRRKRFPIALVVSAWDLASEIASTPDEWLRVNLPLLSEFLLSNADASPNATFGVSAQGADWSAEGKLSLDRLPADRAFSVAADGSKLVDIAGPLRWVLAAT